MDVENLSSLEYQISQLTSLVQSMLARNTYAARVYGICAHPQHHTNMCPMLQEDDYYQFNAYGGFMSHQQRRFDPYSDTYNSGWQEHPNFSYGTSRSAFEEYYPVMAPPPQQLSPQEQGMSLEEIVNSLANNMQQFQ